MMRDTRPVRRSGGVRALSLVVIAVGALLAPVASGAQEGAEAAAPQEDPVRSRRDEWRDVLRFGITSEITEVLPSITEARDDTLAPDVLALLDTVESPSVLQAGFAYLGALELPDGRRLANSIVIDYTERSVDLVTTAIRYMRDLDLEPSGLAIESLLELAERPPVARAVAAIQLLAASSFETARLIELYDDDELAVDVRGEILIALGDRGDPAAYEFVADLVGEGEVATTLLQRYAIDTLGRLGDARAIPTIVTQLGSSDALTRAYAVSAIARFDDPRAGEALEGALRDDFWRVRVAALDAVGERQMANLVDIVAYRARRDPETPVRLAAIETLRAIDTPAAWDALEERLADRNTPLAERFAIIDAMIQDRPAESIVAIRAVLDAEWDDEQRRVLDGVGRSVSRATSDEVEPLAARLLEHPNYIMQIYGVRAVASARIDALRAAVLALDNDATNPTLRAEAIRALEDLDGAAAD